MFNRVRARTPHAFVVLLLFLVLVGVVGGCRAAPVPEGRQATPARATAISRPSSATVSLVAREWAAGPGGVQVEITYQNVSDTTMSVSAADARCVVTAFGARSHPVATIVVALKPGLYAGSPSGGRGVGAPTGQGGASGIGVGEGLMGSGELQLREGEYTVIAAMASDPGIRSVPTTVMVPRGPPSDR